MPLRWVRRTSLMTKLSHAVSLTLAAAVPAQQDFGPLDFVPTDAAVIAWVDGPARLSKAFRPTRLGTALDETRIPEDLVAWFEELGEDLDRVFGPDGFDAEAFGKALATYEGKVVLTAGVDEDSLSRALDRLDPSAVRWWASLIVTPNEDQHASTLVRRTTELIRGTFSSFTPVTASGITFSSIRFDDFSVSMPIEIGDHMVLVAGNDMAYALEHTVTADAQAIRESERFTLEAPMGLVVRPGGIMRQLVEAKEISGDDYISSLVETLVEAFGFAELETMVVTAEPVEEHTRLRTDLHFRSEPRGILGAFVPTRPGAPKSLEIIPSERDHWSVTRINWRMLYASLSDSVDVFGRFWGTSAADLEEDFASQFRVRLEEDVIAHLGDELIQVGFGSPGSRNDEDIAADLEGICYGVSLLNPQAFEDSLERMIRSRGLHAARKTEIYRGLKLRRITVATMPIYYATPGEHLLVGIGNEGARELRAVLATILDRRDNSSKFELPEPVRQRLEYVTPGWQNINAARISSVLDVAIDQIRASLVEHDLPSDHTAHHIVRNLRVFVDVLRRHDLDLIVSTALAEGRWLRSELIW